MSATRNGDTTLIWLGMATFASLLLFVWQGLDFTDMGFWLTGYQLQYTQLDTFAAACWLSNFIGHWLGWMLGQGVLAYKLGYVAVVTMSAMIAYWLLAAQLGRSRTLAGAVFLTVLYTRGYGGNWLGYNELTALFYLAGAALLFFGLSGNRKQLVVLSGVLLGANLFVRFPNLLGISLVSAIWLQAWACRWSLRDVGVVSSWFVGGFTLGVALIFGLIALNGQAILYLQGIQAILGLAVDADSHHPGASLLSLFISDHLHAFYAAAFLLVFGCFIATWIGKQEKLLAAVFILTVFSLLVYVIYIQGHSRWLVPGLCYIVLLSIIFLKSRKEPHLVLLAFIAGMVLLLVPLGSNNGMSNSVYGMWLALPLTITWLWRSYGFSFSFCLKLNGNGFDINRTFSMDVRGIRLLAGIMALALLLQSLALAWRHTYLDSNNRFAMTHSIPHPLLQGIFTTSERAKVVTELLDAMAHFTKPGDAVLAYNAIPTVHFLTETLPWLGDPWPDLVDAEKLATLIRQKEQASAGLPCIVRATGSTYVNSWPAQAQPVATWWHQDESRQVFAQFEQRNGYVVVWSNRFFEILSPGQPDTKNRFGR